MFLKAVILAFGWPQCMGACNHPESLLVSLS